MMIIASYFPVPNEYVLLSFKLHRQRTAANDEQICGMSKTHSETWRVALFNTHNKEISLGKSA